MGLDSLPTSRLLKLEKTILAGKSKKTAKESGTKITRITSSDTKKIEKPLKKAASTPKAAKAVVAQESAPKKGKKNIAAPFVATGDYFKGAWYELRQVRWPTRRATWSLTGAILAFTAVITVIILLLDALFKYLFELMLG